MKPIEGSPELAKDPVSGAIVNCDKKAYSVFLEKRNKKKKAAARIDSIEESVDELKQKLELLIELVQNGK